MSLSNLTTSGWVLFAFALLSWTGLLVNLIGIARGDKEALSRFASSILVVVAVTVWFVWLVTP